LEDDADVISNAAEQRMAHVRTFQLGQHVDFSQKLLNEIAAARVCLLVPEKKARYDAELKAQLDLQASSGVKSPPTGPPAPPDLPAPITPPLLSAMPGEPRRSSRRWAILASCTVGAAVVAATAWTYFPRATRAPESAETAGKAESVATAPPRSPSLRPPAPSKPDPRIDRAGQQQPPKPPDKQPTAGKPASVASLPASEPPKVPEAKPPAVPAVDKSVSASKAAAAPAWQLTKIAQPPAKIPVPGDAAQEESLATIREIYSKEYNDAKTAAQKKSLAEKLLEKASDPANDPVARYVLLGLARDVAALAGEADLALQAIDELAKRYDIDADAMKREALAKSEHAPRTKAPRVKEPRVKRPATEKGWITLFDGHSLSGWQADQNPGAWSVVEGEIVGESRDGVQSHLYFRGRTFANFEAQAEVKINSAGNSGFFFRAVPGQTRTRSGEVSIVPFGYEIQIVGSEVPGQNRTGSLYKYVPVKETMIPDDAWFTLHLRATGNRILISIDGKEAINFVDIANTYARGYLALQVWRGSRKGTASHTRVSFRNIRVKPLP
jgi:hypothetical protein